MITDGKLQSDCDDIRFTDINGKLLEHRINKNNGIFVSQTSQSSTSTSGTSFTFQHKVTSGSNQALVVIYHGQSGDDSGLNVTNVTINGVALDTEEIEVDNTTTSRSYVTSIWTMVDPFDGLSVDSTYDIVVTLSSSATSHVAAAYTLTGVNQSDPSGVTASNTTGTGSATSLAITGTTGTNDSLIVGGSLVRADANFPRLVAPGVQTYWQQVTLNSDSETGGAGGYLRTTNPGSHSLTITTGEGASSAFNGAWVEMKPVTSTTDCNTVTSDLEVLVDSIPSGGTDIFMYYGNSQAIAQRSLLVDPNISITDENEETTYTSSTSQSSYNFNHTVSAGSNKMLIVIIHGLNRHNLDPVSQPFRVNNVSFNGDNLQVRAQHYSYTSNRDLTSEVWVLVNPDEATGSVVVTYDATVDEHAATAITLSNVNQYGDTDWWIGAHGAMVTNLDLNFTIRGSNRWLIGGAVEIANQSTQLDVSTPGTRIYQIGTGTSDNQKIQAAGGYQTTEDLSLNLYQASTINHINGAGIVIQPENTYAEFTPTSGPTLQSEEKSPGPVLYWKLDETSDNQCAGGSNDICDSTNNLNDGTYSATRASGSNCLLGGCYQFNGTTNVITLPTASDAFVDFAGSEAFSGSAWIYVTTMPTGSDKDAVIAKWDENSNHAAYRLYVENDDSDSTGNMAVQIYDESASQVITATGTTDAIAQNTWYHVAFTFNGGTSGTAGDLKIYVNGSYQAQNILNGSFAGLENLASDFTVADYDTNDSTSGNTAFTGTIDEVKMFAYARSAAHMQNDYLIGSSASGSNVVLGGGLTPMPTPVAHWKFDDMSGTTAQDSGSGDNDLTLSTASWTTSGKFGGAFNGTGGAVRASRADDADLQFAAADSFTLSAWIKSDSAGVPAATEYIIAQGATSTAGYAIYINTSGYACFAIDDDTDWSTPDTVSCTTTSVYDATWHHIVGVKNESAVTVSLYVDGVLRDSDADATSATFDSNGVTYVGDMDTDNEGTGEEFAGDIDEVKIYRSALSAAQVLVDMNADGAINLGLGVNEPASLSDGDYQSSLVGYWPLDENKNDSCAGGSNDVCDRSGNGNDGASTSSPAWIPGFKGSALQFNSSNYVSVTDPNVLDFGLGDFSYTLWANLDETQSGTTPFLVRKHDPGFSLNINASTNVMRAVLIYNGSGSTEEVAFDFDTESFFNQWAHYAVTYNRDGYMTLYINGVPKNATDISARSASNLSSANDLTIGGATGGNRITGSIDEVKFFNTLLTPAQVAYEYNRGEPITWYRLDECEGTAINDMSGKNLTGTLSIGISGANTLAGNCLSNTSSHAWSNGKTGKINSSMSFDDTDDYISVADTTALDLTGGLSLAAWVKTAADEANNVIISKGTSYEMGVTATGALYWDGVGAQVDDGKTLVGSGTWHHVAITNNDTTATYYVDGIQSSTSAAGVDADNATTLYLGYDGTNFFDGHIDDVRIYNYPLSATQVKSVMNGRSVRFE